MTLKRMSNVVKEYLERKGDITIISKSDEKISFKYLNKTYDIRFINESYSFYRFELYDMVDNYMVNYFSTRKKYTSDISIDTICDMIDSLRLYNNK